MFSQPNYKYLQSDPTSTHLALGGRWCSKWAMARNGEISP